MWCRGETTDNDLSMRKFDADRRHRRLTRVTRKEKKKRTFSTKGHWGRLLLKEDYTKSPQANYGRDSGMAHLYLQRPRVEKWKPFSKKTAGPANALYFEEKEREKGVKLRKNPALAASIRDD